MMFDLNSFINVAYAAENAASSGIAGTLGINLKLFIAQLINFSIILAVLWKFVFIPVAKKLNERTEKIEKAMADAANTEKAKNEFVEWKETEMVRVRSQAQGIITAAQNDASKAKDAIMAQAKTEQQKIVEEAKQQIEQEKNSALTNAKSELADLVVMATEKILKSKLDKQKDQELIKDSLTNLQINK